MASQGIRNAWNGAYVKHTARYVTHDEMLDLIEFIPVRTYAVETVYRIWKPCPLSRQNRGLRLCKAVFNFQLRKSYAVEVMESQLAVPPVSSSYQPFSQASTSS